MAGRFKKVMKSYSPTFWVANTMELFERWAWYGMFMLLGLYLTGSRDTGALGFSQSEKGMIMGTVTAFLYFLPVITGALADKFGYKKTLVISYLILSSGYLLMGFFDTYLAVFVAFFYVGIGAALFKPIISATVSKTTNDTTSSIGFGIFYMMVNIGAFIGPVVASKARELDWFYVFVVSAVVILVNLILVLFFFKEPPQPKNSESLKEAIGGAFKNIYIALKDLKFVVFLLLIVGFWTMYNQLFYSLPVFIDQWVDTGIVYQNIASVWPGLAQAIGTDHQTIAPEMMTNIDALYIILFQLLVSTFVMRFKPLNTMISGILVASIGIGLSFVTQNGMYLFFSILIFGLGEMASSPKITEYIGKIAPADKKALYMGTSFLPMAGGNFLSGILSGGVYERLSDKISILQREVAARGLTIPEISENFTQNDYILQASELMGLSPKELTDMLWQNYNPSKIWLVFTGIGLLTVIGLAIYDRFLLTPKTK